jgi:hypothetical protein
MEFVLDSRVTCASTFELSIVQIGLETYRRYESETKRKSRLSADAGEARDCSVRREGEADEDGIRPAFQTVLVTSSRAQF